MRRKKMSAAVSRAMYFASRKKWGRTIPSSFRTRPCKILVSPPSKKTKIDELVKTTKETLKEKCKHIKRPEKNCTQAECAAYRKAIKEVCDKVYPECMSKLERILDKEQIQKLETRIFQYFGFVPNSIVLDVLKLSDSQKKQLSTICDGVCSKVQACCEEHQKSDKKRRSEPCP
eukprot:TRINITY_DN510_c0_g2_i1.p2 TRINITY_DN510_c0_g2~~TRINITY_DN510_c0_g2_i1.p2  ORF type:complete len:174 (+),score=4.42 TRINITY_DN510_c0_g2_i1:308-829(+)